MYNESMECYQQIVYDLNELAGLVGKVGEKYFTRIIENLDKLVCNCDVSDTKKSPNKK